MKPKTSNSESGRLNQARRACATVAEILGRNPQAQTQTETQRRQIKARTEAMACNAKAAHD